MLLYQNHLVSLNYEPAIDVLSLEWPTMISYDLLEVERTLDTLVQYIRDYDVKRLLIDGSRAIMPPGINMVEYEAIITEFAYKLAQTRLCKSARIVSPDKLREAISHEIGGRVTTKAKLKIESRDFATKAEALEWLTSQDG